MKPTAVKVFTADSSTDLEHDINEWMTDPSEHDGIVSVQYQVLFIPEVSGFGAAIEYSALVHYVVKQ